VTIAPAVRTESLTKIYAARRSLREMATHPWAQATKVDGLVDVTMEVPRGVIFGLLGPNGAGKTTLLKILAGLILPTRGSARVDGLDVATADRDVRRAIGFVTADERSFYWRLSGEENLMFFARLYGLASAAARSRIADLVQSMDLQEVAARPFMDYSSGMKQRLAICRALLHDPPILCLDEPTRSLDPIAAKHLRRFVADRLHRARGKTIVLATHNLQEAEEMCQHLAVLHRGRVVRQGSLEQITSGLPGRDQYLIQVAGIEAVPSDPRWEARLERPDDGALRIAAAVDRGGRALTDLLRALLEGRGTILSCTRREPSLQEVFDLIDGDGGAVR
jgi:ABC-2 type transport system ATP-binding protein